MRGRGPSKEDTAKDVERRKAAMDKYFARTKEAEDRLIKKAAGVKEPVDIHPPKDVLDLTVMNLLADPALLDGRGSEQGVRTLTEQQRRQRQREQMDERASENRKALNSFIKADEDDEPDFGYRLNYEGDDLPEDLDDLHDELADDDSTTLN